MVPRHAVVELDGDRRVETAGRTARAPASTEDHEWGAAVALGEAGASRSR